MEAVAQRERPMRERFFITTAIDYTNGPPHIGHAYEKVLADVIARHHRARGEQVFFLTGVDQHGQKVQQSAEKQGVTPEQFVQSITAKFLDLWKKLDVRYDRWAATIDPLHKLCVQRILQRLWDEKDAHGNSRWLYKAKRAGYYSVRQEQFLTDKERGADGEFGPEWGEVVFVEEENYYFRLAESRDWLLALLDRRADFVFPDFRRSELRNAVEKLTGDLSISRPKSRLNWGIEIPFDREFVTYVWFDALVNYISFAPGYDPRSGADLREFRAWWPATHVIGKDILIPAHGIYWPIMLKAIGFADDEIPPLVAHGWWNVAGAKMSKSVGNIVDPDALADSYGVDALRYYLMSDIHTGRDADFSEERLVQRYNSELANTLGNLLNRTLTMTAKYRGRRVAKPHDLTAFQLIPSVETLCNARRTYEEALERFAVNEALQSVLQLASLCNEFIETSKPWVLAKAALTTEEQKLDAVLYHLAESLRIIAILISPVLPQAAAAIFDQLDPDKTLSREFRLNDATWGGLKDGHLLGEPKPLFPRIDKFADHS